MIDYEPILVDNCANCETGCIGSLCPYFPHKELKAIVSCNCCGKELDDEDEVATIEEDHICRSCIKEHSELFFDFTKVKYIKKEY
ncbi:MAG: hypothetical protein IJZ64_01895 [Ruminococcus sp.]|nr:hypothetical protein [Ruminococcus sp.]